jgi:hypothetical protein
VPWRVAVNRHSTICLVLLVAAAMLHGGVEVADAEVSSFTFEVPEPELRTSGGSVYFGIEGFGASTNAYYPVLPTRKVNFEIPYGAVDISVTVTPAAGQSLGRYDNYLMQSPPISYSGPTYVPPRPERIPDVIPIDSYRYGGVRMFRGHKLVEIVLYPLQYRFADGRVTFVSSYSIQIFYSMPASLESSVETAMRARSPAFEPLAAQIIENYGNMNSREFSDNPPSPLYDLTNPAYAIITTPAFEAPAETLAAWKTKKGVPTKVYMLSYIDSTTSGVDTQERIRNFLKINDSIPRFDYALLLGDTNTLPDRKCWDTVYEVPCDFYFSDCVDGAIGVDYDWDTNDNLIYGEFADTITWLPDVYVGRIASRTAGEVQTIVDNILSYEKNPPPGNWMEKAVFGAAFVSFPTPELPYTDLAAVGEQVRLNFLDPAGDPYDRLYEIEGIQPTEYLYDFPLTASNFENRVGLGCGLVYTGGHGNPWGNYRMIWEWDNGDGYYQDNEGQWADLCNQSQSPANGGMRPFVIVSGCNTGRFDDTSPCLGDVIIATWGIGAMCSSRPSLGKAGWDDPDLPFNQGQEYRCFEEILANGKYRLGQIHGDHKYHYCMDFNSLYDGIYGPDQFWGSRRIMFTSNLFGDPELPIWTDAPQALDVAHASSLPLGPTPYTVSVTSGGTPVEAATVCLWKGNEVYLVGETDPLGGVTLNPSPVTEGTMYVTVTKHNYIPYEGAATASTTAGVDPVADPLSAPVILGNRPNPFSRQTAVRFGIPRDGRVRIDVYDVSGRTVASIIDEEYPAGYHSIAWIPATKAAPAGIYFVRLRFGSEEVTCKAVISR